jgi:hypothetical protein
MERSLVRRISSKEIDPGKILCFGGDPIKTGSLGNPGDPAREVLISF